MSKLVTIYGGSGFVGRYIAYRMARAGWRVRVAVQARGVRHVRQNVGMDVGMWRAVVGVHVDGQTHRAPKRP